MVQTGQTSEAEKYIMQMLDVGAGDRPEEISRSGNIVVDSLINHAYAAAQKDNVQFNVNVLVPASLPFESGHLAIVLGNLLENALEACQNIPDEKGFINLDISYAKDIFQLCIKNNYQAKRKKDIIGHYITTKGDNIYHGLGLSSINHAIAHLIDIRNMVVLRLFEDIRKKPYQFFIFIHFALSFVQYSNVRKPHFSLM